MKKIGLILLITLLTSSLTACVPASPYRTVHLIQDGRGLGNIYVDPLYDYETYEKEYLEDECVVTIHFKER